MKVLLIGRAYSRLCDPSEAKGFFDIVHANRVYSGFRKDILSKTFIYHDKTEVCTDFDNFSEIWLMLPPRKELLNLNELQKHKEVTSTGVYIIPPLEKYDDFYKDFNMKAVPTTGFITLMYLVYIGLEVWMTGFNFYEGMKSRAGWHDYDEERAYAREWIKDKPVNLSLNGGGF